MEKLDLAQKALDTFHEILKEPFSVIVRDATIQRFEYSSEVCWKALQAYLKIYPEIEVRHPKGCYQKAFEIGLIDETLCIKLRESVSDRNRTSHAYIVELAEAIFRNCPEHAASFQTLLDTLRERIAKEAID